MENKPLIETVELKKYFKTGRGLLHAVDDVVEASSGREGAVAVVAHVVHGAVFHCLVHYEHLREVVLSLVHAEQLGLDEAQCGEAPAGAGTVLVLDGGDGVLLDGGKGKFTFRCGFLCCCAEACQAPCGDK